MRRSKPSVRADAPLSTEPAPGDRPGAVVVGVVMALALGGGAAALGADAAADVLPGLSDGVEHALVSGVTAGDELEVGTIRQRRRLQLVGVRTASPASSATCLADRARASLAEQLPDGADVAVRPLRGAPARRGLTPVLLTDAAGRPVEQTLVALGLALPGGVRVPGADLEGARREARRRGVGFHDPAVPCSVPGRVGRAVADLSTAIPEVPDGPEHDRALAHLDDALAEAAQLRAGLATAQDPERGPEWQALTTAETRLLQDRLDAAVAGAEATRFLLAASGSR